LKSEVFLILKTDLPYIRQATTPMQNILLAITPEQKTWLDAKAKELGISRTELIRRILDDLMGKTLR
jgi:hypothetical protein